ncbi:MAG: hypothetical protein LBT59_15230 [Clostridiales bacterium]|jgi:hypothetical protein|nr:hypothetical protein [Clostridiales bacterium]
MIKFKKELTNEQYQGLEPKREDTLYFISDTGKIYHCATEYGGRDFSVADTDSVSLDSSSGLTGDFILSSAADNFLSADNGLWVPPIDVPRLENPVEGDFVTATGNGQLKDSGYSLSTEITEDSENEVPTAAAVYTALEELALIWEDEPEIEDFSESEAPWKDYTKEIAYAASVTNKGRTYLHFNGTWVRLHLDVVCSKALADGIGLLKVPSGMLVHKALLFPAVIFKSDTGNNWLIKGSNAVWIKSNAVEGAFPSFTTGTFEIIADLYYVIKPKMFPLAP